VKHFEIAIVGGSIAGSSLAIRLGRAGISTVIIDKARFPRRKACGEGLSDVALENLSELDLVEDLLKEEHHPFYGYRACLGKYHVDIAYREPRLSKPKGCGIQRNILDNFLFKQLKQFPSVESILGKKVKEISRDDKGYVLELDDQILHSEYLVLADGANSSFAKRLGVPCKSGKSPSWGISWMFEGNFSSPINSVVVIIKNGYEIYCTPVSENRINVCYLARKHKLLEISDKKAALREIKQELRKARFSGIPLDRPLGIGPIGCSKRPIFHERILLVGDALESLDPISGMGMTHALISSKLVANALQLILREESEAEATLATLAKQREVAVRPFRGFTRLTGFLLRSTRNHGRILDILSKTSLPEKIREVLGSRFGLAPATPNLTTALLMILGI
jgi:flavin-dependent dehydrogenase